MSTPEDPQRNIIDISQIRSRRNASSETDQQGELNGFIHGVVRIEGSNIYDENQVYFGSESLNHFIARMESDSALDEDLRTGAIVFAEQSVFVARAHYINSTLNDRRQRDKANQDLAEYTWDKAAAYESESLQTGVETFISQSFTIRDATAILERLHLRTKLTETQLHNEEVEDAPALSNIIIFKPRNNLNEKE